MRMVIGWILGFSMILIAIYYLGCSTNGSQEYLDRVGSVWVGND